MKTRRGFLIGSCFLALLASSCAPDCHDLRSENKPPSAFVSDTLFFGTHRPKGMVSAGEWKLFLKKVVTPLFPAGLTSWEANGQWKGEDGKILREKTEVLLLVHPDNTENEKSLQKIIELYKSGFHQQSVLRVRGQAKVSF